MADKKIQPHRERGSVLIIALVVLAIMAFIVGIVVFIINNSVRSNRSYSNAIRSIYALEGGEEYGLYLLYSSRLARTQGAEETAAAIDGLTDTFTNEASYTLQAAAQQEPIALSSLDEDETAQLDLFAEEYTSGYRLAPLTGSDPMHLVVSWDEDSTLCTSGDSRVELSFTKWSPLQWQDFLALTDYQNTWVIQCPLSGGSHDCSYTHQLDPNHLYRVRLKAVQCPLDSVTIATENATTGASVYPLNTVAITGTGEFSTNQESGVVTAPWSAPIIDYFDYVLFSEQDIIK